MEFIQEQLSLQSVLASLVIFGFILYPRFNRWPEQEAGKLIGLPRDYINSQRYYIYALFYLSTFALFAIALSNIEDINLISGQVAGGEDSSGGWMSLVETIFGERSFVYCLVLVSLLLMLPAVDKIDQRWRAALLTSARVPKESMDLKNELVKSLPLSTFNEVQLSQAKEALRLLRSESILPTDSDIPCDEKTLALIHLLLRAFYIAQIAKTFDPNTLDQGNIDEIEDRLNEIAAISQFVDPKDTTAFINYKNQIDAKVNTLLEIIAKNCVRIIPSEVHRYTVLSGYGFNVEYSESGKIDYLKMSLLSIVFIVAATTLTVLVSLQLFDAFGIAISNSAVAGTEALTTERLYRWSLGGSVSYMIAAAFGVFFNEVSSKEKGESDFTAYLLAFIFAALGSCVFFKISSETFQWPFVWLAISFGLLSVVAIQSRNQDLVTSEEVLKQALVYALCYAAASGVLQVLIKLAFSKYHFPGVVDAMAFFLFGALRGGVVAFLVSYVLLDAERALTYRTKRHAPRILYRKVVETIIDGKSTELVVRDLSEYGARVRMTTGLQPVEGDHVKLDFGFIDIRGQVIWVKKRLAGIRFDNTDPNLGMLRNYISSRMREAYTM